MVGRFKESTTVISTLVVSLAAFIPLLPEPAARAQISVQQWGTTTNSPPIIGNGNRVYINLRSAPESPTLSIAAHIQLGKEFSKWGRYDDAVQEFVAVEQTSPHTEHDFDQAEAARRDADSRKQVDPDGAIAAHTQLGIYSLDEVGTLGCFYEQSSAAATLRSGDISSMLIVHQQCLSGML